MMKMDENKMRERIRELEARLVILERDRIHDSLTGLKTRAFFEETAKDYLELRGTQSQERRQKVGPKNISIIFFDIDHFKEINDTHGHLTGDLVLREVSSTIQYNLRDSDVVARWGGEEIIALLPGATEDSAKIEAEKIRTEVEKLTFKEPSSLKVTVSAGITGITPGSGLKEVIACADKALYWAKNHGRNRIISFSELKKNESMGEVA